MAKPPASPASSRHRRSRSRRRSRATRSPTTSPAIGIAQRERARIEAEMNDEIAAVKQRYEEARAALQDRDRGALEGRPGVVRDQPQRHHQDGRTKTVVLTSGEIQWRMRPPKVVLKGVDMILDKLKRMGLDALHPHEGGDQQGSHPRRARGRRARGRHLDRAGRGLRDQALRDQPRGSLEVMVVKEFVLSYARYRRLGFNEANRSTSLSRGRAYAPSRPVA
jgi:phage host-nuclease inhibitor protein Gam